MNSAKAYAPGNISCIFVIKKTSNPRTSGSLGVGFTVNKGVIVTISKSNKTTIFFNNKKISIPTVTSVQRTLTKETMKISIKSDFPLGCGFGISGASSLATGYSINKLLKLKKTKKEIAVIAHTAEVENGTGLGDVTNQYFGGLLIKNKSSSKFQVKKVNTKNKTLYYKLFSKLDTKKIISNSSKKRRINKIGMQKLNKLKKTKKTVQNIIQLSKEFSLESRLANSQVRKAIKQIESQGGHSSMIMLGNAVFSDIPFKGSKKIEISDKGAYII